MMFGLVDQGYVVRLNSDLSFIVLATVNNPTDYEHIQSYNSRPTVNTYSQKISIPRGRAFVYHVIL